MKRIFLAVAALLLMASVSLATPFLVCDPPVAGSTIPTVYKLSGGIWVPASVPAMADGTIMFDVVNAPIGGNLLSVTPCAIDPIWGEQCADPFPFTFIRPAAPATINNIRLTQ